jgi:hypothetical protein
MAQFPCSLDIQDVVYVGVVVVGENGVRCLVVGAEENLILFAHGYARGVRDVGSTARASAILRMVRG